MDLGWVVTVASPDNPSAPGISVGVDDVDAVHARALELGYEIAYPLRDPGGTIVNVVSHRQP